jgi:phage shock protein PspC (stress-responsive transcriptional regulator)
MATNTKTFRRLPVQGKIFGVCAGIADYFDMDVTLLRVIFVVLTILSGGGLLVLYLALALIMPVAEVPMVHKTVASEVEDNGLVGETDSNRHRSNARNYVGLGLVLFGVWLLLGQFFPAFFILRWEFIWPVILILIGLLIATKRR